MSIGVFSSQRRARRVAAVQTMLIALREKALRIGNINAADCDRLEQIQECQIVEAAVLSMIDPDNVDAIHRALNYAEEGSRRG